MIGDEMNSTVIDEILADEDRLRAPSRRRRGPVAPDTLSHRDSEWTVYVQTAARSSALDQPKSRSPAGFTKVTRPSGSSVEPITLVIVRDSPRRTAGLHASSSSVTSCTTPTAPSSMPSRPNNGAALNKRVRDSPRSAR